MGFTGISLPAHRPVGATLISLLAPSWGGEYVGNADLESIFAATNAPSDYVKIRNISSTLSNMAHIGINFGVGTAYNITRVRIYFASSDGVDEDQIGILGRRTGGDPFLLETMKIHRIDTTSVLYVDYYGFDTWTDLEEVRIVPWPNNRIFYIAGVVLYTGDFEFEFEREAEILEAPLNDIERDTVTGTTYVAGHPPKNAFDLDTSNYWALPLSENYNGPSVRYKFSQDTLVNFFVLRTNQPGTSYDIRMLLSGSLDDYHYEPIAGNTWVRSVYDSDKEDYYLWGVDLRQGISTNYRYYRMSFAPWFSNELRVYFIGMYRIGRWVLGESIREPLYVSHSSTYPMLIASTEPRTCEALSGAVTSSEEDEGLYLNRIYREPFEAEGFCGAIGGEFDWETEDFYIEREISAQAFISPFADLPMLARDMNGLAGFGRQCNGAITIRHSVEGSTGEFALMDDATRSRYEMEGHCGTRAEMTRQLSMAGFAQPGNNSSATLFREPLTMSALAGAIAGGTRTVEVSATALQHLFASLASSLPARTALATAVVDGMAWGDCTLHSRQMDAEAVVSLFSHGSQTVPARWAEGQAMTGGLTSADLMLPTYTVEAQGVVDALATAHFLRTNYRMTGKTRGSRFDTYLLKYEAPL